MHAPLQLGKCLFRLQLLFQGIMSKEAEDYYVTETAVIAFFLLLLSPLPSAISVKPVVLVPAE